MHVSINPYLLARLISYSPISLLHPYDDSGLAVNTSDSSSGFELILACFQSGVIAVPVSTKYTDSELVKIIKMIRLVKGEEKGSP